MGTRIRIQGRGAMGQKISKEGAGRDLVMASTRSTAEHLAGGKFGTRGKKRGWGRVSPFPRSVSKKKVPRKKKRGGGD